MILSQKVSTVIVLCRGRFLHVGQVTLEVIKMVPEVDMVVQCILRTSFLSMQSASLTFDTVEGKTA